MIDLSVPPLRIAMVAPPWYDVPPRAYGGIESMCADLVHALTERGHQITLIGAGRNGTPARFVGTYGEAPGDRIGEPLPEVVHAAAAARFLASHGVDVVHDHSLAGPLSARGRRAPTVVTVHGEAGGEYADYLRHLGASVHLVAISDAQRRIAPELSWVATVHNGIDVASFPYRPDKEDFAFFLGRLGPDKGAHLAIDAAREAGRRIVLAGKLTEPAEHAYFDAEIKPRLGPDAEYVGEADAVMKRELLSAARCLLFPIQWEEPFGLVMAEAMACGTPVVTLRRGAAPEVVADGVTGFVRDRSEELAPAIDAVDRLRPADCRTRAERHFDVSVMADGYERVYAGLAAGKVAVLPAPPVPPMPHQEVAAG